MSRRKKATDKQFREIIEREFGPNHNASKVERPDQDASWPGPNRHFADADYQEPFNFAAAMEAADPYPDDYRYQPNPLPLPRVSRTRRCGWALLLVGVGLGLAALFGAPIPRPVAVAGGVTAVAGLTILLLQLKQGRPDELGDDGAQL